MTNEEILFQYVPGEDLYSQIELMLDAARKDEAVAFAEWILQSAYHKEGCWYLYKDMSGEIYTTNQLYTVFKQQNS